MRVNNGKMVFKLDEEPKYQLNGVLLDLGDKPKITLISINN